jgi:uncharacterized protein
MLAGCAGLTAGRSILKIQRLMSANVPEMLDVWRMVAAKRSFEGRAPLSEFTRLQGLLFDTEGEVSFALQFDSDALLKVSFVELRVDVALPLECQRSLQRFVLPVHLEQRLGLIRDEADEAALPEEYEALLVPNDGMMRLLDLVEDELVLAVPAVPLNPESDAVERDWPIPEEELAQANPFAGLASLKKN